MLLLAGCGGQPDQPATGDPRSPSTGNATASSGPAPPDEELDEAAAAELLDRVVATDELVDLVEFESDEYEPGEDDQPCGPPPPEEPLAKEVRYFGPEEPGLPEVHQTTSVYRTATAAEEAFRHDFESLEACRRSVAAGQVVTGYARAAVPDAVELDARVVTATMTIPGGREFAYQHGCVIRGSVAQCISVYTREAEDDERWFARAFVATSENLQAEVPGSTGGTD